MEAEQPFRAELARLVRQLLEESQADDEGTPISEPIQRHLGGSGENLQVFGEELPTFELPNLQVALEAALSRPGFSAEIVGVTGQARRFSDVSLSDLLTSRHYMVGPPEYVNADVGPGEVRPCLAWAVLLVTSPSGAICVFVRRGEERGPRPGSRCRRSGSRPTVRGRSSTTSAG